MLEIDGGNYLHKNSKIYSLKVSKNHLPHFIDGLKKVQRRCIWVLQNNSNSLMGSLSAIGAVKEIHSAGDEGIYSSAIRLTQDFIINPPLLYMPEGSDGTYMNPKPAALRYTTLSISKFAKDLFFNHMDINSLSMVENDVSLDIIEPEFLIPIIPFSLVFGQITIGYGKGTKTMFRNFEDICDLTIEYLKSKQRKEKFNTNKYLNLLLPDTPIKNYILNKKDILRDYKDNKFDTKILLEGYSEISRNKIKIYTMSYSDEFNMVDKIREFILKGKKQKSGFFSDIEKYVRDVKEETDHVVLELKQDANPFKILNDLRPKTGLSDTYSVISNYVSHKGYVYNFTPLSILNRWYEVIINSTISTKRKTYAKYIEELDIINTKLVIIDNTDDIVKIIKDNSVEDAIKLLNKKYQLTYFQCRYITDCKISIISKTNKEKLLIDKKNKKQDIEDLLKSFIYIEEELIEKIEKLKNKYPSKRKSLFDNYIGYIYFDKYKGSIQIESMNEIEKIKSDFPNIEIDIYKYEKNEQPMAYRNNKLNIRTLIDATHRYIPTPILTIPKNIKYTCILNRKEHKGCLILGNHLIDNKYSDVFYLSEKVNVLDKNGNILKNVKISDHVNIQKTKTDTPSYNTDVSFAYPYIPNKISYLFLMNTSMKNTMLIYRIDDIDKIMPFFKGITFYKYTYHEKDIILKLDKRVSKTHKDRYIKIKDIMTYVNKNNNYYRLKINQIYNDKNIEFLT